MPNDQPKFTPTTAIFCDDIRHEVTKKEILIGVYPSDLVAYSTPITLKLAVYLIGRVDKGGESTFFLELEAPNKESKASIKLDVNFSERTKENEQVSIALPATTITISQPGDLVLRFSRNQKKWQIVRALPVKFQLSPMATGQINPSVVPEPIGTKPPA